jgi:hypothetical protein
MDDGQRKASLLTHGSVQRPCITQGAPCQAGTYNTRTLLTG